MRIGRRDLLASVAAATTLGGSAFAQKTGASEMYGLIGKMIAAQGRRDALIAILIEGTANMPGCLSYVIAKDASDENAIWITEAWDSKASHEASLSLPAVQDAIRKGKPMITGFGERFVTTPIGGEGLKR